MDPILPQREPIPRPPPPEPIRLPPAPVMPYSKFYLAEHQLHSKKVDENAIWSCLDIPKPLSENPKIMPEKPQPVFTTIMPPTNITAITSENFFELLHQPNEKQRKSYRKENRCLLPNPITISQREKTPKVDRGTVSVRIVYENREELEESKQKILDGDLVKSFDVENKAQFALKILETSESRKFRLLFSIKFVSNGNLMEEVILSHPFSVTSNKKKLNIESPKVFDIKPKIGLATEETEVWIKGKQFTERTSMTVKFGGKPAKITETEENLITCTAPSMGNIAEDTTVSVEVANFHPAHGQLVADTNLSFTYISGHRRKRLKSGEPTSQTKTDKAPEGFPQTETNMEQPSASPSFPLGLGNPSNDEFLILDLIYDMGNKDNAPLDNMLR